jgi:hypothetical protein
LAKQRVSSPCPEKAKRSSHRSRSAQSCRALGEMQPQAASALHFWPSAVDADEILLSTILSSLSNLTPRPPLAGGGVSILGGGEVAMIFDLAAQDLRAAAAAPAHHRARQDASPASPEGQTS